MKKITLFLLLAIFALTANAQRFSIGVIASKGDAWSRQHPSGQYQRHERKPHNVSSYGLQTLIKAGGKFYISNHVSYSKEGFTMGEAKEPAYTNFEMEYIRLNAAPVFYPLNPKSIVQPKVSAGLSVAYLVGGVSNFTDNAANSLSYETKDISNGRFDFGYRLEAGIDFKVSRTICITTGAAYYNGTVRIPEFQRGWENRSFTFNTGVLVRTSRK